MSMAHGSFNERFENRFNTVISCLLMLPQPEDVSTGEIAQLIGLNGKARFNYLESIKRYQINGISSQHRHYTENVLLTSTERAKAAVMDSVSREAYLSDKAAQAKVLPLSLTGQKPYSAFAANHYHDVLLQFKQKSLKERIANAMAPSQAMIRYSANPRVKTVKYQSHTASLPLMLFMLLSLTGVDGRVQRQTPTQEYESQMNAIMGLYKSAAIYKSFPWMRDLNTDDLIPAVEATPLQIVSLLNESEQLEYLIKSKVDINKKTDTIPAPVFVAVMGQQVKNIERLIEAKADLTSQYIFGNIWHAIASTGNTNTLELFLKMPELRKLINDMNIFGTTPLMRSVERGDYLFAKKLIELNALIDIVNPEGGSAISLVIRSVQLKKAGASEMLDFLLNRTECSNEVYQSIKAADPFGALDKQIRNALVRRNVAPYYKTDYVKLEEEIYAKSKSECAKIKYKKGQNPALTVMAQTDRIEVINYLLENKADVEERDVNGKRAIENAIYAGHLETVKVIAKHMTQHALTQFINGRTVLHHAVLSKNVEIVEWLLTDERVKELINKSDQSKIRFTPLTFACARGQLETAKLLIEHKADVNEENEINSPLRMAIIENNEQIANYLLAQKADLDLAADVSDMEEQRVDHIKKIKEWVIAKKKAMLHLETVDLEKKPLFSFMEKVAMIVVFSGIIMWDLYLKSNDILNPEYNKNQSDDKKKDHQSNEKAGKIEEKPLKKRNPTKEMKSASTPLAIPPILKTDVDRDKSERIKSYLDKLETHTKQFGHKIRILLELEDKCKKIKRNVEELRKNKIAASDRFFEQHEKAFIALLSTQELIQSIDVSTLKRGVEDFINQWRELNKLNSVAKKVEFDKDYERLSEETTQHLLEINEFYQLIDQMDQQLQTVENLFKQKPDKIKVTKEERTALVLGRIQGRHDRKEEGARQKRIRDLAEDVIKTFNSFLSATQRSLEVKPLTATRETSSALFSEASGTTRLSNSTVTKFEDKQTDYCTVIKEQLLPRAKNLKDNGSSLNEDILYNARLFYLFQLFEYSVNVSTLNPDCYSPVNRARVNIVHYFPFLKKNSLYEKDNINEVLNSMIKLVEDTSPEAWTRKHFESEPLVGLVKAVRSYDYKEPVATAQFFGAQLIALSSQDQSPCYYEAKAFVKMMLGTCASDLAKYNHPLANKVYLDTRAYIHYARKYRHAKESMPILQKNLPLLTTKPSIRRGR